MRNCAGHTFGSRSAPLASTSDTVRGSEPPYYEAATIRSHGAGASPRAAYASVGGEPALDLPEGINVEEARMLEAAMLGIPYQGRIPDFSQPRVPAATASPETVAQRFLIEEQDQAFEESLAADR